MNEKANPIEKDEDSPVETNPKSLTDAPITQTEGCDDVRPTRSSLLMSRHDTAILVVDVQQKLVPHIHQHWIVTWNVRRLVDAARILGVPRLVTEQYPQGLGSTIPELQQGLVVDDEKAMFSCRECKNVARRLNETGLQKILLCGIETHVCVQQTALDFLAMGFDVWLAVDACGSRSPADHRVAMRRMESAGVSLTTTESAMFEWCEISGTPEFKRISELVQEPVPDGDDIHLGRHFPSTHAEYVLHTNHSPETDSSGTHTTNLSFVIRKSNNGQEVCRFVGQQILDAENGAVISSSGVTGVEVSSDGATVSIQYDDGHIETLYLPISQSQSRHPRWKVRKLEHHINSEEYRSDYKITFQIIEYASGNVFRELHGFEHRLESGGFSHISGVRKVEISRDGCWMVVTTVGRPPEVISMPLEVNRKVTT